MLARVLGFKLANRRRIAPTIAHVYTIHRRRKRGGRGGDSPPKLEHLPTPMLFYTLGMHVYTVQYYRVALDLCAICTGLAS